MYLIKYKDEAFDMILTYKIEIENQLNGKMKRFTSNKGIEYVFFFNNYCVKECIIHEVISSHSS